MSQAIEITRFKLVAGATPADFVAANADVDVFLRSQPGFVSRRIVEEDGYILDMVVFERATQARRSAERLMRELADSPVHALIDHRTVSWQVARIVHEV
jgi:hypothetical protein